MITYKKLWWDVPLIFHGIYGSTWLRGILFPTASAREPSSSPFSPSPPPPPPPPSPSFPVSFSTYHSRTVPAQISSRALGFHVPIPSLGFVLRAATNLATCACSVCNVPSEVKQGCRQHCPDHIFGYQRPPRRTLPLVPPLRVHSGSTPHHPRRHSRCSVCQQLAAKRTRAIFHAIFHFPC
jgi:hypothetical protein